MDLEATKKVKLGDDPTHACKTNDTDENEISTSTQDNTISMETRDLSQSISKFRGRWEKAKLKAETDLKNTKCSVSKEPECAENEDRNSVNNLEYLQPAAMATYEQAMKQLLQINSPISVRLESFNYFDHIAQALAALQFERDAMKALGRLEPTEYGLVSKKLAAELNQMRNVLWIALMVESVSQKNEEDRRKQLERQLYEYELKDLQEIVLKRKEEERKTEEVEKDRRNEERKRREEEQKLEEVEMRRRDEERKCKEVEKTLDGAKQQLSYLLKKRKNEEEIIEQFEKRRQEEEQKLKEAQVKINEKEKMLMDVEMKKDEEEKKAEVARRTVVEAKKNLELLEFQLTETQKKLQEVQGTQNGLQALAVAKTGERKHPGGEAASKGVKNSITLVAKESAKEHTTLPSAVDNACKQFIASVQQVGQREPVQLKRTTPGNSAIPHRASNSDIQGNSGSPTASATIKRKAITELPSRTVAIHLGLSRTKVGIFRPGTTEFQIIAEVENCLYYRDGSFLLAYNDSDKLRLNPTDVNFEEILVQGPIDEKHEIKLNEQNYSVRKEHIISTFFAVLKWKAELELQFMLQNCVIVLPQFLNDAQRSCVYGAARIAGFNDVKLIDDTVAIALEYMMRKKERERYLIVACAMEGVIDVGKFHITAGSLRRLEVGGTHFLHSERANKRRWGPGSILSFFTWSSEEKEDILRKIFSNNELNIGKDRFDATLKLFAGDAEVLNITKRVLNTAKKFEQVGELNAVEGGALVAALFQKSENCPLYKSWESMRHHIWGSVTTFNDFKQNILSMQEKERKRSSNPAEGVPMTVAAMDFERKEGHLRPLKDLHDVKLDAVKIIRSIEVAVDRKQIRNLSSAVLLRQLAEHKSSLQQPNLRLEEANKIRNELLDTWHENVLKER